MEEEIEGKEMKGRLAVFLFTDIVGSVDLQARLGTEEYTRLLLRYVDILKAALAGIPDAAIHQDTGDGHLVFLPTAADAVRVIGSPLTPRAFLQAHGGLDQPGRGLPRGARGVRHDEGADAAGRAHHQQRLDLRRTRRRHDQT